MLIVFDVNETLLNVRALGASFEAAFGDEGALKDWFGQLLRSSYVVTLSGRYEPFSVCADHALAIVAQQYGVELSAAERRALAGGMRRLPPHDDVVGALERLQGAGYRLATLTNSAPADQSAQLDHAGLAHFFESTLSVASVRRFKPSAEPYQMAARTLGVSMDEMLMVAAHNWDCSGAKRAGARAAFVARPGQVLGPLDERPDFSGPDLGAVADQILALG